MSLRADEQFFSDPSPAEGARVLFATFHENERPLLGLAGAVDWRLCGLISEALRSGAITGARGEWAYFPVAPLKSDSHPSQQLHVFLYGQGTAAELGKRAPLPAQAWEELAEKLAKLNLSQVIFSAEDLGESDPNQLKNQTRGLSAKGVTACVTA